MRSRSVAARSHLSVAQIYRSLPNGLGRVVSQIAAASIAPVILGAVSNLNNFGQIVFALTTPVILGAVGNLTNTTKGENWVRRGLGLRL